MRNFLAWVAVIAFSSVMVACNTPASVLSETPTATETVTPSKSPTASPTVSSMPTATYTLTPTPTQTFVVPTSSPATLPPAQSLEIISASNLKQLQPLARFSGPDQTDTFINIAFSPDGKTLAIADDETAQLWDLQSGKIVGSFSAEFNSQDSNPLYDISFSPDGRLFVEAVGNEVWIWKWASGEVLRHFDAGGQFHDEVFVTEFSPNGKTLVTSSFYGDAALRFWDVQTGKLLMVSPVASGGESAVAFSPNGNWLVSAGRDGGVRQWNATTGKLIREINACLSDSVNVRFSPDGRLLAVHCDFDFDRTLHVYDANTWKPLRTLGDDQASKTNFSFSQDGQVLVLGVQMGEEGSGPTQIEFWDVQSDKLLDVLDTYIIPNKGYVEFSPDGRILAIAEVDGFVYLFGVIKP